MWIEPTAPRYTSEVVLAQEEHVLSWAMDAQGDPPAPSTTVDRSGLDVLQADAAASVAGDDRLVLVVGPAGAGKTTMLRRAVDDLECQRRRVFGLAPTAKAARVLARDTRVVADTVAKLLHEWNRPDRTPADRWRLPAGTTLLVDEAGMIGTPALCELVSLAQRQGWRLALVGDHRQLQAVGRGGLFHELCRSGRVDELEQIHRFTQPWEAAASLLVRAGDQRGLDAYEAHGRIIAGTIDEHLARIATSWIARHERGEPSAMVASSNDHVDAINAAVQTARIAAEHVDPHRWVAIDGGERAHPGDVVATRRNDRRLITTDGEPVRNRETWTVAAIHTDGALTVTQQQGHGTVHLPADYVRAHVRLGYAATEHGYESDTVTAGIELASAATTRRGLYVGVTRGRDENLICVITDTNDIAEARDVLDAVLAVDRADIPAVTQRRILAHQHQQVGTTRQAPPSRHPQRCRVPDWFDDLLADTRHDLDKAQRVVESNRAERTRRAAVATAAHHELERIDLVTAPEREMLAVDTKRADQARHQHATAQRRLASSGRRGRREARWELDIAERILDRAEAVLERTRRRTAPAVERYRNALRNVEDARTDLRHHDLAAQLDRSGSRVAGLERTGAALDTWCRWANGYTINTDALRDAVETLTTGHGTEHDARHQALGRSIGTWADATGIELHLTGPLRHESGLELGL